MTSPRVVIVDYGIGNLLSARRAFEHCGAEVMLTSDGAAVKAADRLVLPGVGAFASCIRTLSAHGLVEPVLQFAASGRPMIGICVGMQMLFDASDEFGENPGLCLLPGRIKRIPDSDRNGERQKIPHIGWNALTLPGEAPSNSWADTILDGLSPGAEVYFVHSYTAWPENPSHRLADADYGGQRISAVVRKDNIFGTQFHPEKSGPRGLAIIQAFLRL
jgi:glutamine amidotransferase